MKTQIHPTRAYRAVCPGCGKITQSHETVLGVPGGKYEDYPLKQIDFECTHCTTRFIIDAKPFIEADKSGKNIATTSPKPNVSTIQARWEAGEDME